jgi:toxin ParE1/3/4
MYRISQKALDDLEEIWFYTFKKWSIEQADRYSMLIMNEIEHISVHFNEGKSMEYIRPDYRAVKVKSHLIFYRMANDGIVEIIRILHQMMDIENRLNE